MVIESNLETWPSHSDVFAGTLRWEEWFDIYAAVRALQQVIVNMPPDADQRVIRPWIIERDSQSKRLRQTGMAH